MRSLCKCHSHVSFAICRASCIGHSCPIRIHRNVFGVGHCVTLCAWNISSLRKSYLSNLRIIASCISTNSRSGNTLWVKYSIQRYNVFGALLLRWHPRLIQSPKRLFSLPQPKSCLRSSFDRRSIIKALWYVLNLWRYGQIETASGLLRFGLIIEICWS